MAVSILYDYNNAMAEVVGARHGLTESMLRDLEPQALCVHENLESRREKGEIGFYALADYEERRTELDAIKAKGDEIAERFDDFVVLGIGGSALGPICVHRALNHIYYNLLGKEERGGRPRFFVLDNIDPDLLADFLDLIDPRRTCFNVISKSGETPETISQFMGFYDLVKEKVGDRVNEHFVVTTSESVNNSATGKKEPPPLRVAAERLGMDLFWIPENVGGRFSELSVVGLLPAAVTGIDIHSMIRGAQAAAKICGSPSLFENPAYLNGAIHFLAERYRGKRISVLMPYSEALREVADWYRQLWAESLGKRRCEPPNEVFVGQTPARALGTTDQHSQIQLYVEGPNDKIVTFVAVGEFDRTFKTGTGLNEYLLGLDYLAGREILDLFRAEMEGTEFSLSRSERPNVRITLGRVDAEHIGALLFFYMVQTAFTGGLYGINAFDQPGVEMGKRAAAALMGRLTDGDGEIRDEIEKYNSRRTRPPLKIV